VPTGGEVRHGGRRHVRLVAGLEGCGSPPPGQVALLQYATVDDLPRLRSDALDALRTAPVHNAETFPRPPLKRILAEEQSHDHSGEGQRAAVAMEPTQRRARPRVVRTQLAHSGRERRPARFFRVRGLRSVRRAAPRRTGVGRRAGEPRRGRSRHPPRILGETVTATRLAPTAGSGSWSIHGPTRWMATTPLGVPGRIALLPVIATRRRAAPRSVLICQ